MKPVSHISLDEVLTIVKRAGYRVSKPRPKVSAPSGPNAIGKPYGANYDPNHKLRTQPTKIGRLYTPYPASMRWVEAP